MYMLTVYVIIFVHKYVALRFAVIHVLAPLHREPECVKSVCFKVVHVFVVLNLMKDR